MFGISIFVGLFDDGQLRVAVLDGQSLVGLLLGAVHHQRPLLDETGLHGVAIVSHFQPPLASRILAPGVCGHEGPLDEAIVAIVVVRSAAQYHRLGAHGRHQMQGDITSTGGVECDHRLHVLDVVHLRLRALTCLGVDGQVQTVVVRYRHRLHDRTRLAMETRRHRLPQLRQTNHRASIQYTIAEQVIELQAHSVHVPKETILAVVERIPFRCQH